MTKQEDLERLRDHAKAVLREDDRGGYTVPAPRLYPYQWLWDSGFVALGWREIDEERAWRELNTLLSAQWADGMIPHVVFHEIRDDYFPGPDFWQGRGPVPSTGITQPPILATVVRRLYETCSDRDLAERQALHLVPKLLAFHRWFYRARDPGHTGLCATFHPWESGMDNSPLWDGPLARVSPIALNDARRDTGVVAPEQRPHDTEYQRYLSLVATFRELGYDAERLYVATPFRVANLTMNSVLQRANRDLKWLADELALHSDGLEGWIEATDTGIKGLWDESGGFFFARDLIADEPITIRTFEGFMPLFAGAATKEQASRLASGLASWLKDVRFALPSVDPASPLFEPRRYWRGPVWLNVNWMLHDGLKQYGYIEEAMSLKRSSFELVKTAGFYEYFDPVTGEGLGGASFAWSAALVIDWLKGDPV